MDPIAEMRQEIKELRRQNSGIARLAQVTAVDPETSLLTCVSEGLEQSDVRFFAPRVGEDQVYWLPSVGELGFLIAPSGEIGNSVFLGGIFYNDFPAVANDVTIAKRKFRGEEGVEETVETSENRLTLESGESVRVIDGEKIQDTHGDSSRTTDADKVEDKHTDLNLVKIDNAETVVERGTGNVMLKVGSNLIDMSAIAVSLLGALIFPNGITALQTGMGPVFFSPAGPAPGAAPPPPAGSNPDSDGNVQQTPPSEVDGITIRIGSKLNFTIPALPVTTVITGTVVGAAVTGTGAGNTTVTPVTDLAITGEINVTIPSQGL